MIVVPMCWSALCFLLYCDFHFCSLKSAIPLLVFVVRRRSTENIYSRFYFAVSAISRIHDEEPSETEWSDFVMDTEFFRIKKLDFYVSPRK